MAVKKFGVSLHPTVMAEVDHRVEYDNEAGRSAVINRHLERYFSLLARARRELRQMLSDAEAMLICDVLNGVAFFDTFSVYLVEHEVSDGIALDRLDQKWGVDGPALVEKMRNMGDAQEVALVDSVTLWWNRVAKGEEPGQTAAEIFADH